VSHLNIGSYVETVTAELESAPQSPGCSWVVPRCGDEAADGHQRHPSADWWSPSVLWVVMPSAWSRVRP